MGDEKCDRESAVVFVTDVNNEELIEVLIFDLLWQARQSSPLPDYNVDVSFLKSVRRREKRGTHRGVRL